MKQFPFIIIIACCISCNESQHAETDLLKILATPHGWIVQEVKRDNAIISDFEGMELFLSPSGYKTKGSSSTVWPGEGDYSLETASSRILIRDDGNELFISELDQDHLVILFDFRSFEPVAGRAKSNVYSFTFIRHQ